MNDIPQNRNGSAGLNFENVVALHYESLYRLAFTLAQLDEAFQAPVAMFYLENCPYKEFARILEVPLGKVKSRIARGIAQLHKLLTNPAITEPDAKDAV